MKLRFALLVLVGAVSSPALAQSNLWRRAENGVVVQPSAGPSKRVEVSLSGDGLFHVVTLPRTLKGAETPTSLMVEKAPVAGRFTVEPGKDAVTIRADRASARISLTNGQVSFFDRAGKPLLSESAPTRYAAALADGKPYIGVSQQFNRGTDESVYGLGQHQNMQMDLVGEDVELAQHNMDIAVPFIVSTRNYGLLWDNNGISRFGNPKAYVLAGRNGGLTVTSQGKPGFHAEYFLDGKSVLVRRESAINYQYIRDQKAWPKEAIAATVAADGGQNTAGNSTRKQTVVWTGTLSAKVAGDHKFQLYSSSYFKVFVNDQPVLDRWRQNWNPWYHNFDVPMQAGKPVSIRIEWEPNQGYMALLHSDPLPQPDRRSIWFTSDVAKAKSYWFVPGKDMDDVIAGYRQLTGKSEMLPKWAYGFWQSRQRYKTQDELTGVVDRYRGLGIPLDNIVLDWFYWRENDWGSHNFDPTRFPDPEGMIRHVHDKNVNFMISVWPKFYKGTDNFAELDSKGLLYQGNLRQGNKDWVGPGYASTYYDPYSAEARKLFWQRIEDRLATKGVDAWWADASEPDMHSNLSIEERIDTMGPTAMGPGAEFFNSYPLMNARAFYEGWTKFKPDARPFLLTRSGFAGLQRTGAAVWSGDVASRWDDLRAQISAGVSISMSGIANWTHDIGGFALEDRYAKEKPAAADLEEWRELNLRWFQFGAFSPLFRSHGEFPLREIYEIAPEGSPMRASMIWHNQLRYRLMPYTYTLAADTWMKDGSIMRGMAMDFPNDLKARKIDDQYLFGKAFLIAPISQYRARSRQVWFPGKTLWHDFHTGKIWQGGTAGQVDAPYERMPIFVRAGSIIPVGPVTQYVDEKRDAPLTIAVYAGADGQFSLYEDDGRSTAYKQGDWSRIGFSWDEKRGVLTIGAREGKGWAGMPLKRNFQIKWLGSGKPLGDDPHADQEVSYDGTALTIKREGTK